jgi:hypothetical protein
MVVRAEEAMNNVVEEDKEVNLEEVAISTEVAKVKEVEVFRIKLKFPK